MKDRRPAKLDLAAPAAPLQADPFAALAAVPAESLAPDRAAPVPPPTPAPAAAKSRGRVLLRREKKDRGGKTVVVVSGFPGAGALPDAALDEVARTLRKRLGCGGAVEGREIVLQGDRPAAVAEALRGLGFAPGGVTA